MLNVIVVVGNPKPKSRTMKVGQTLAEKLFSTSRHSVEVIDLVDYKDHLLNWPSEVMDALNAKVAASDVVIFASPTYKATYTGLLKAFLDRYPSNGLKGVTAIPVMTGADLGHSLGPTVNFAPLLAELGAIVPGRGFYFVTASMDRLDEIAQAAANEYSANLQRLMVVGAALSQSGSAA